MTGWRLSTHICMIHRQPSIPIIQSMELFLLILSTFIVIAIFLFFIFSSYFFINSHSKLPPGPWQLPIIGNLHQLFMSSSPLPHHTFHTLAKTCNSPHLLHLKLGQVSMVVVTSPQAAREILKTHDLTFASRPLLEAFKVFTYGGRSMSFSPYGQYWKQLRRICILELLSPKRVHSFGSVREEEVHRLIQSIMDSTSSNCRSGQQQIVNLSEMLSTLTNNIMTRAAVGNNSNRKDQIEFVAALKEAFEMSAGFSLVDLFPSWSSLLSFISGYKNRLGNCHLKMDRVLDFFIQQHKHTNSEKEGQEEDLLDVLLRLQQDESLELELTDDNIKAVLLDIIGAGTETTSTTVAWAMSELMRNPRVMRKAQSEVRAVLHGKTKTKVTEADIRDLNYMQLIIRETLRLHPPGPLLLPRECQEKCEILGYEIPHKSRVVVNVWALGRDPQYWEDAETFMPERFEKNANPNSVAVDFKGANYEFLPFGSGRRICPGISMGLAMMELPLAQLLYYFNWELPQGIEPHNLDMEETFGVAARRKSDLCLRPHLNYINP